jgi:aspartate/methionine/tyrosine aminotransferase
MKIKEFAMERFQSTWENTVRYNLSESGVHPLSINELLENEADRREFLNLQLGYNQANGSEELRSHIAAMYEDASAENILVGNGTAEVNFIVAWALIEPGDEVLMLTPSYLQFFGLFETFGAIVKPISLLEEQNWSPDFDALESQINAKTKIIVVTNPNNPTGAVMSAEEMRQLIDAAERVGAWLVVDEVFRGAERLQEESPSFWGKYEKTIITSGLSKAYGLPGLRIGWIVATEAMALRIWAYHDYTTICPSRASDFLASIVMRPEKRQQILGRTKAIIRTNYPVVREWIDSHGGLFSHIEPQAGAIAFLRYHLPIESGDFVERLRIEKSLLACSGEHFGLGKYLRVGFGSDTNQLSEGLAAIDELITELQR